MNDKKIIAVVALLVSFLAIEIKAMNIVERPINSLNEQQQQQQQPQQIQAIQKESILHTQDEISTSTRHLAKIKVNDDDLLFDDDDNGGLNDTDDDFGELDGGYFKKKTSGDTCVAMSTCELCHGGKRSGHEGCSATGKRVKSKCIVPDGGGYKMAIQYKPCNRTPMDEEYVMIQFQAICLFFAFISLKAVRREKIVSASLFELRTRRKLRQEMVPLTKEKDSTSNLGLDGIDDAV